MNIYYNSLFLIFIFLLFLIVLDSNVANYIILLFKFLNITFHRFLWLTLNHPLIQLNPLSKMLMYKKYYNIAKELEKEVNNNEKKK